MTVVTHVPLAGADSLRRLRNDFLHWFLYLWCVFWIILSLGICLVWLYRDKMPGHQEVRWVSFAPRVSMAREDMSACCLPDAVE